jgi:hypothetical protein
VSPLTRIATAVAAALAAVALIAGCGGDDAGPATDATTGLSPEEILTASAEAARGLESFRVAFEATGTGDLGPQVSGLLGETIDISGEGLVRPPDAAAIDATVDVAGLPLQVNLTRLGDDVVLGALGRSIALELAPETLAYLDFGSAYPELTEWISAPAVEAGGEVDGASTVSVSGGLDPDRVLGALGPLLGDAADADVPPGALTGTATIQIGVEDLLPRRIEARITGDAGALAPGAGALDLTITADLSDFGTTDQVTLPPADETLRPDQLGSLLGG